MKGTIRKRNMGRRYVGEGRKEEETLKLAEATEDGKSSMVTDGEEYIPVDPNDPKLAQ